MKNQLERYSEHFDFKSIETFEDACERLDLDPSNLPNLSAIPKRFKKPLIALYKLMIVAEAINDSWIPDFGNLNQEKFFPIFEINTAGRDFLNCKNSSVKNVTRSSSFLCFQTQDKAFYMSTQFTELFKDYLLIHRSRVDPSVFTEQDPAKQIIVRSRHGMYH